MPATINIPTELLRTLVTVVDQRSFTKAAQILGITQPAVSAQIKRLQLLLGSELLDKSAPGVSLTPNGDLVVNYARRLLSVNDEIVELADPSPRTQTIRIGTPGDFIGTALPWILADFRRRWPDIRFQVRSGGFDAFEADLRRRELDLFVTISRDPLPAQPRHQWKEDISWVGAPNMTLDRAQPVPLVTYGQHCTYHRLAVEALSRAGRSMHTVFTGTSLAILSSAVAAGLGVMILPRSRIAGPSCVALDGGGLPELPQVYCSVYVGDGENQDVLGQLADAIAADLHTRRDGAVATPPVQPVGQPHQ